MHPDLLTVGVLDVSQPLLVAAVLFLALRGGSKPAHADFALSLWALALLLLAAGFAALDLVSILGFTPSILTADALFLGACASAACALRALCGAPPARMRVLLTTLSAWLAVLVFTTYAPQPLARQWIIAIATSILLVHAAWPMLGAFRRHGDVAQRMMVVMIGAIVAGQLWQAIAALGTQASPNTATGAPLQIELLVEALSPILISIGFLMLYNRANQQALERLARIDAVTGVANSEALFQEGERLFASAFRHGRSISLLHIDVDHFRRINDIVGQRGGDRMLRAIAAALQHTLRTEDFLSRLHGKEFVALLPDTVLHGARESAERLRENIATMRKDIGGRLMAATVSIGVTDLQPGDRNLDMLLERSSQALRAAKRAGCNRIVMFSPETADDAQDDFRQTRSNG